MNGRFTVSLDTFMPLPLRGRIRNQRVRHRCTDSSVWRHLHNTSWSATTMCKDEGVDWRRHHILSATTCHRRRRTVSVCDFTDRDPKLWSPYDLRRFRQARYYNVSEVVSTTNMDSDSPNRRDRGHNSC